jgi:hypothetical protein
MNLSATVFWIAGAIFALIALVLFFTRRTRLSAGAGFLAIASVVLALTARAPELPEPPTPTAPPVVTAIVPDSAPAASSTGAPDTSTTSLVLGGVVLKVARADHYSLAVDRKRFLILDTRNTTGMVVSCDIGDPDGRLAARILRNRPIGARVVMQRPDNHTLLIQKSGQDLMRVRLAEPGRIEVLGRFHPLGSPNPVVVTQEGIEWPGGRAAAGKTVDLRRSGKGTVDFESSGRIRVIRPPRSQR